MSEFFLSTRVPKFLSNTDNAISDQIENVVATQGGRVIATEAAKGMATIVLAKEVSKDITKQQRCNKCEPYQSGNKHEIERSMGHEINTQYQFKIANLSSYPLTFRVSELF
ncbi:hypothetical protein QDT05_05770 [Acinetobacter baumannii]|uniref:hypothetical protein n=1 Tax=Acinetobacter baumannii TaxID=470 RepID=UPI0024497F43|nr:hypothetical protein [Acinetobacter baumannii]MDH2602399.1 hypothetical protein [Acinetobacter baumannii]